VGTLTDVTRGNATSPEGFTPPAEIRRRLEAGTGLARIADRSHIASGLLVSV